MIRYSIIIPHKNSINTLIRCLKSIPDRNDIQVIVIDDNSNLEDVEFNFQVASNVKIILTKEGRGAGYARNKGLLEAQGKWILFADADDFFEKDFDKILDKNYNSQADIVYYETRSVISSTLQAIPSRFNYKKYKKNIDNLRFSQVPWGKMIKRQLIREHNVKFDETLVANDAFFSVYYGVNAKKIEFIDNIIYISTVRENSLFFNKTLQKELIRLSVAKKINVFLTKKHLVHKRICILNAIQNLKPFSKKQYKKELIQYLKEENLIYILLDFYKYCKSHIIK